jgi:hypothetical protein
MAFTITNVGISDITRFESDAGGGTVSAHVRLNFSEGGLDHQLGLAVDLNDASDMTLAAIESAALREAARVIGLAATLEPSEMEAMFRTTFAGR